MPQATAAHPTSTVSAADAPLTCFTMSPTVAGSTVSVAAVVAALSGLTVVVTLVDPDQQVGNALPTLLLFLTAVGVCVVAGLNVRWLADHPGAAADARAGRGSAVIRGGGAETPRPATPGPAAAPRPALRRPTATPAVPTDRGLPLAATPTEPILMPPPAPLVAAFTAQRVAAAPQAATFTPLRRDPAAAGDPTPSPAPAEPAAVQLAPADVTAAEPDPADLDPAQPAAIAPNSASGPAGPPGPDAVGADHPHDVPRDGGGADAPTRAVPPRRVAVRPRRASAADKNSSGVTKGKDAKVTPKRVAGRHMP